MFFGGNDSLAMSHRPKEVQSVQPGQRAVGTSSICQDSGPQNPLERRRGALRLLEPQSNMTHFLHKLQAGEGQVHLNEPDVATAVVTPGQPLAGARVYCEPSHLSPLF